MFNLIAINKEGAYSVKLNISRTKAEREKNLYLLNSTETDFYITKLSFKDFCKYKKVSTYPA